MPNTIPTAAPFMTEEELKKKREENIERAIEDLIQQAQQEGTFIEPATITEQAPQPAQPVNPLTPETQQLFDQTQQQLEQSANSEITQQVAADQAALAAETMRQAEITSDKNQIANEYNAAMGDYDMMLKSWEIQRQDIERQRKEHQEAEMKKEALGGTTEFLSNIINLIGTSKGAANQEIKSPVGDWKRKAEDKQKEFQQRADRIKDAKADLAARKAALQQGKLEALRNYDKERQSRETAAAQQQVENAMAAAKLQMEQGKLSIDQYKAETDRILAGQKAYLNEAQIQKYQADAAAAYSRSAQSKAQANYYNEKAKHVGENVVQDRQAVQITFEASGDNPRETISIRPQSLFTTISANIDELNDLSPEDKKSANRIIRSGISETEKARQLLPIVKKSAQLRELVKASSVSPTTIDDNDLPSDSDNNPDDEYYGSYE